MEINQDTNIANLQISEEIQNDNLENENIITIQTHDKRFHADEVGAVSLLTSYFNQQSIKVHLIRSRKITNNKKTIYVYVGDIRYRKIIDNKTIYVDVGGIYDPSTNHFDHHQTSCNETFDQDITIPLSSIGMVWKHYGKELLELYIKSTQFNSFEKWEDHIDSIHKSIYIKIILELDAHDNGVQMVEGGKRNYWPNLQLSSIIASMNTDNVNDEVSQMNAFEDAVSLFGKIFEIKLWENIRKYFDYQSSYDVVKNLMVNNDNEYLIMDQNISTIFKCLNVIDPNYRIKFLIMTDTPGEITIRTRSKPDDMYAPMVPLLSYEEAHKKLGNDLIFIHKCLFIGKTKSLEGAVNLVNMSLSLSNSQSYEVLPKSYLKLRPPQNKREWLVVGGMVSGLSLAAGALLYNKADY